CRAKPSPWWKGWKAATRPISPRIIAPCGCGAEDGLPGETITVVEGLEGCHSANISPDNRTLWVRR
ncbi:hypothetical protein C0U44_32705, partial [Klebsiella pneumoniae]